MISQRPLSVMAARDPEVLSTLLSFYRHPEGPVLDATAGDRRMWSGVKDKAIRVYLDLELAVRPDVRGDFRRLPFRSEFASVVVFDPPHLPRAAASPASMRSFAERFGLKNSLKADDVSAYFSPFLREARRVLRPEGLLFAKLCDYVHNHKRRWVLVAFITAVRGESGLTPCDLIVKRDPAGGNLKSGRWRTAHHSRNCHSWWVVVRKGGCESKVKRRA